MRWRIYYADGTTYSDRQGEPFYAPPNDVQVVCREIKAAPGFQALRGNDAYYWRPDVGWNPCDQAGLWDYLLNYCGPKAVIFG